MTTASLIGLGLKLLIIGQIISSGPFPPTRAPILATVALLALIAVPLLALRPAPRAWTALALNLCLTALALADLWYFRFSRDVLSVTDLNGWWQWQPVTASLSTLVKPVDALAVLDVMLLAWLIVRRGSRPPEAARRRVRAAFALAATAILAAIPALDIARRDPDEVFEYAFVRTDVVAAAGLAGYHAYDVVQTVVRPWSGRVTVSDDDARRAAELVQTRNAQRFASPLAGVALGRSVIFLSAESLQTFALGLAVGNELVAPNLTSFAKESLQFTNFYDQTHRSTTSDAEFIALNSLLPPSFGAAATRYAGNEFRALPHVLGEHGYRTLSASAEPASFWNMGRMHPRLGFERSLFQPDFQPARWVGSGLDDAPFFAEMAEVLKNERAPFFAYLISSSNHHPYDLPEDLRQLSTASLPGGMAGDYLQSVRHFDTAFGQFIAELKENGVLDRTVIVVFGDHQSWVPEADLLQLWRAAGHQQPPSPREAWRFRRQVPMLVRLPGAIAAGARDRPGGHLDLAPTVLSLVGVDPLSGPWLGRDLTSPARNVVAFRDGSVTDEAVLAIAGDRKEPACYANSDHVIGCEALAPLQAEARSLLSASDTIVAGNTARTVTAQLHATPASAPRRLGKVLVIAHRGDSLKYPENTLDAIRSAFDLGADAVEVDIRLSRDGVPFVFHDDTLERTSTGSGPPEQLTLKELKSLDAGRWMAPAFAGARIPTLDEVLTVARGRGSLLLDLKNDGLAPAIRDAYDRARVDHAEALVGAWTPAQRDEFVKAMPHARILKTDAAPIAWGEALFTGLRQQGLWGFEIGDYFPAPFIADSRLHGTPVIAYTVNDEATLKRLIESGVSGIETDDPALLLRIAKELGAR